MTGPAVGSREWWCAFTGLLGVMARQEGNETRNRVMVESGEWDPVPLGLRQPYDPDGHEVVAGGWEHEHCVW